MNWQECGLLDRLEESDKIVVSEMLDKVKKIIAYENEEYREVVQDLFSIVRVCFDKSGITDVEWLAKDYKKWYIENEVKIKLDLIDLKNDMYVAIDAVLEIQRRYSEAHGNRYLKEHGLGKL